MNKILGFLMVLVLFSSCQKEGDFDLNFKALFGNDALVLNEAFELDDIDVKFENLTMIVTDISIVNEDDERIELSQSEFVAFNNFDQIGAESGQVLSFSNIPTGSYKELQFTIGVPADLNKMQPGDFQVDEPLGRSDHYWEAWGSYIFSKTEGNADVDGDGVFDLKFFYHTGSDALARTLVLNTNLVVDSGEKSSIELFIDYNELLRNADGTAFDIEENPRNHDPNKMEIVTQYVDNYAKALKVRR
jgi:hypothetical protein